MSETNKSLSGSVINTKNGPIEVKKEEKESKEIIKEALTKKGRITKEQELEVKSALQKEDDNTLSPSGMFGLYLPRFIDLCNILPKKGLNRVVRAMIAYPLEDLQPNWKNPHEKEAYLIGLKLLEARFVLTLAMGLKEQERLEEQKNKEKKEDGATKEETKN